MSMGSSLGCNAYNLGSTAAGTVTIKTGSVNLYRMVFPANATGTVTLYDSVSGTSALNYGAYACTVGTIPTWTEIGLTLNKGLTAVTAGTTNVIFIYD